MSVTFLVFLSVLRIAFGPLKYTRNIKNIEKLLIKTAMPLTSKISPNMLLSEAEEEDVDKDDDDKDEEEELESLPQQQQQH